MIFKSHLLILLLSSLLVFSACRDGEQAGSLNLLSHEGFDTIINNRKVQLFTLRNSSGCVAQFTNFGARWISMWVPGRNGKLTDVLLGFNNLEDYISAGEPYHGAIVGRICGRIDDAEFFLDGKKYILAGNDLFGVPVKNHLHGGINGFHIQVWESKTFVNKSGEQGIIFSYFSPDGEEGFPGNLNVEVHYTLSGRNELIIEYRAVSDETTIVNLTNHAYFNLNGEGNNNILNHMMKVNSNKYIECDRQLIPTGKLIHVRRSPLDYSKYKEMGECINTDHDQIFKGKGYAAAMVIKEENSRKLKKMASAYSTESGIKMDLYSDKPSIQLYNAWLFDGTDIGKSGRPYLFSGGFVMEAQGYPDAPNHLNFPSITIRPDEVYSHKDIYRFSLTFKK